MPFIQVCISDNLYEEMSKYCFENKITKKSFVSEAVAKLLETKRKTEEKGIGDKS